jgi:ADP-ribosylglycohydrolase
MTVILNREELRDKILGCWTGKSIGGTLGAPFECNPQMQNLSFYANSYDEPLPNDDLDLQLVWLRCIEERGPLGINNRTLGEYWLSYIPPHPNEYGISKANQKLGILPPISGEVNNARWRNSNGGWIRSEIWACLAPGCPDIAVRYAYEDASVDHGGGEGTYAELFTAAVESAAFVCSDRDKLIEIGLSKIPRESRVARSIGIVLDCYHSGKSWQEAREAVIKDSEDLGYFQAPANVAFVIIGWVYGEGDFGKSICTAVNCGDDTDCTGATLGAILGIIMGRKNLPKEWVDPVGDKLVSCAIDAATLGAPRDLHTLTEKVMSNIPAVLSTWKAPVVISDEPTDLSSLSIDSLMDQSVAASYWQKSPFAVEYDFIHTKVILDYCREPIVRIGEPFELKVTLINQAPEARYNDVVWHLPDGWEMLTPNPSQVYLPHVHLFHPTASVTIRATLQAEYIESSTNRGILEIIPNGRPNVCLVPLFFLTSV